MIDHYDWRGGREAMLRFGPANGPIVVIAMPLFEEANRTRAFVVTLCRALATRGVASALPDLPGQGESLVPLEALRLSDLEDAYEGAVDGFWRQGRETYGVAIRSGALFDGGVELHGHWHLAPQDGPELFRELTRIKQASLGAATRLDEFWHLDATARDGGLGSSIELAGNRILAELLTELKIPALYEPDDDEDAPLRTVRLDTDRKPADRHVPGTPLWRRAEPGNDPALAALLADDVAAWIARCGG